MRYPDYAHESRHENRANLISRRVKSMQRKEAARRRGLIKFVKKIVKEDEDRINGRGKKCNGSSGISCASSTKESRRLRRLKSPSIRDDNPMIQNLIAAIYRGIARFPARDTVESPFSCGVRNFKKLFLCFVRDF